MHLSREHGGLTPDGSVPSASVLDLSVNINSYGPDPELIAHLRTLSFDRYPDPVQIQLKNRLAELRGLRPEQIVIGNGATEILWATARAILNKGSRWLSVEPQFSEFSTAAGRCGAQIIRWQAAAETNFHWTLEQLALEIAQHRPRLVAICNPCSPTGFYQNQAGLLALTHDFPETIFLIDQSFLSLSRNHADIEADWPGHVLRLISLTKDFALAGLRLGYAIAGPDLVSRVQQEIPTWSVNSLAQAAGLWICAHEHRLIASRNWLLADHQALETGLLTRGIIYCPSSTIFTMLRPPRAQTLQTALWNQHRILVRSCASYGLPDWWRIAARSAESQQRFWTALDREISCSH